MPQVALQRASCELRVLAAALVASEGDAEVQQLAYYLLPTTYYLLPTTYYLLPTTEVQQLARSRMRDCSLRSS